MSSSPTVPRLKKMVEYILEENPKFYGVEARNSDIALTVLIWQRWYNVSALPDGTIHLYRLMNLPREDNVKRVRAVYQNVEHRFLPTDPEVLIKRGIEAEYWEEALGYRLTADEWRQHHKTVKQTTPPPADPVDTPAPASQSAKQTTVKATYVGRPRSNLGKTGFELTLEMGRLEVGKPIKITVVDTGDELEYKDIAAFKRDWKVTA